jgi:hypothetical protein
MLALLAVTLVVCAPGSPGTTAEAQSAMDGLAAAVARAGNLAPDSVSAVYEETSAGGLRRLARKDAGLLLATLPFFLEHEKQLRLVPRLSAMPQGAQPLQRWSLVTGKDHPASLQGYTILSSAGDSKRFVRAAAPGLPPGVSIEAAGAVLSGLRRAANGEKVAVLLDGSQSASLSTLPFASSLDVVSVSPPMPVAVIATVSNRIDAGRWKRFETAFLHLADDPSARGALDGVRMAGFVALDEKALGEARSAYRRAR